MAKLVYVLFIISALAGIFFLGVAAYYGYTYYSESENPLRHEYAIGIAIGWSVSIPFLLFASFLSLMMKKTMSIQIRMPLYFVSLVSVITFLWFAFIQPIIDKV